MKISKFALVGLMALVACTHTSGSSPAPTAAPSVTTSSVPSTFGSVDGTAGGQCTPEVLADDKKVQTLCSNAKPSDNGALENCSKAIQHLSEKYGVIDCMATDADGTAIVIKTSISPNQTSPRSLSDTCAQRAAAMMKLEQDAQSKLEQAQKASFQGRSLSSDPIKNQLSSFQAKYSDAGCDGKSNSEFSEEIQRYTDEIDQLQ